MGLCMDIKKTDYCFNISYRGFTNMRKEIANVYNQRKGKLYEKYILSLLFDNKEKLTFKEFEEMYFGNLQDFMMHSDCDGKLGIRQIKKTLKELEKLDFSNCNYKDEILEMIELFRKAIELKEIIIFC